MAASDGHTGEDSNLGLYGPQGLKHLPAVHGGRGCKKGSSGGFRTVGLSWQGHRTCQRTTQAAMCTLLQLFDYRLPTPHLSI
jgi:hypothetical protein